MEASIDDGMFLMPVQDYLSSFSSTTFSMESSSVGSADGSLHHFEQFDFNNKDGIACFQIQIDKAIDCKVDKFAISVSQ